MRLKIRDLLKIIRQEIVCKLLKMKLKIKFYNDKTFYCFIILFRSQYDNYKVDY